MNYDLKEIQKKELEILIEVDRVCKKLGLKYFLSSGTLIGTVRHKGFIPWDDDIDIMMPWKDYKKFLKYGQQEINSKFFIQSNFSDLWYREYSKVRMNGTTAIEKSYENINFHQGIWIDIFPIIGIKNNEKWIRKFNSYIKFRNLFIQDLFFDKTENLSLLLKIFKKIPLGIRRAVIKFMDTLFIKDPMKSEFIEYLWGFGVGRCFNKDLFTESIASDFEGYKFSIPKDYDKILKQIYGDYMQLPDEKDRKTTHSFAILDLEKDYKEYLK